LLDFFNASRLALKKKENPRWLTNHRWICKSAFLSVLKKKSSERKRATAKKNVLIPFHTNTN
jgi:hypothetical protein